MQNESVGLHEHKCKTCGIKFECTTMYAYKRDAGKDAKFFCSYSCMREYDKENPKKIRHTTNW